MFRLIASDIDGTLVPESSAALNPEYYEVIRALAKKGIRFCACSGRAFESMRNVFAPVSDLIYFICENGNILRTDHEIIRSWTLPEQHVLPFMNEIRSIPGADLFISSLHGTFTECGEHHPLYHTLHDLYHYEVQNIPSLDALDPNSIMKITIYHPEGVEEKCSTLLSSDWNTKLNMTCSGFTWIDCSANIAGKGTAFSHLQKLLNVPREQTIYFGDNINDLSAFSQAGVSITVADAREEVREQADRIAAPMTEDGVLQVLKELL